MGSRKKSKDRFSSRGRKQPKKIREGRKNRSKIAGLQCSVCGRWFEDLGQINLHYSAAGHKRKRHPPKKLKFQKEYPTEDIEQALLLLNLLKNPIEFRKLIRERMRKKVSRIGAYD